jgi:hypothetical protein
MKTFLESLVQPRTRVWCEADNLSPTDIYDFYFLCTGLSYNQIDVKDYNLAEFYLREIKDNYLRTFGNMLAEQIKKYYSRKRVDPNFNISQLNAGDFAGLKALMAQTWRSDMRRRNEVWNSLADYVYKLSMTNNARDICSILDRINNAVHNTEEIMLSKLGHSFQQAYDNVHRSRTPKDYVKYVSPEVRRLMKIWFGPGR